MTSTHGHADTNGRTPPSPLFRQVCIRVTFLQGGLAETKRVLKVKGIMCPAARKFTTLPIFHPARLKVTIRSHHDPR